MNVRFKMTNKGEVAILARKDYEALAAKAQEADEDIGTVRLERFPKRLNPGFPCRRESDSSSLLGGGQHGGRSHTRTTCVDAWSKRLMLALPYLTLPSNVT